eukprot:TRINITY_DN2868_c0_g1_i3.p1 TRINITY_DN2868_c0_g1~~TRINITY_DN2868_c0_g1_i3.p1  ORF type:complete len:281 (+),score=41.01 TRINITY_DN2868_c0_g1_i3:176-1018(+)
MSDKERSVAADPDTFWKGAWSRIEDQGESLWKYEEKLAQPQQNWTKVKELLPPQPTGSRLNVLVPLCGDSPILRVIAEDGHNVVGVDLIARAVARALQLFPEKKFVKTSLPRRSGDEDNVSEDGGGGGGGEGGLIVWTSEDGTVTLVQGDVFEYLEGKKLLGLGSEAGRQPGDVDATVFDVIYDRAALTAIPPLIRQRYVDGLSASLKDEGYLFIDYLDKSSNAEELVKGPPWHLGNEGLDRLLLNPEPTSNSAAYSKVAEIGMGKEMAYITHKVLLKKR